MKASYSSMMGPLLFGLLATYVAEIAGLRGVPVELSSQDRDALFQGLNDIRANLSSSNMECLTKWSTELEAEAQKIASECTAKEEKGSHGVAIIYHTPTSSSSVPTISEYLNIIKEYEAALQNDGCTCAQGQLVPLYRMYHEGKKSMVLTSNKWKKEQLLSANYKDLGTFGYVNSQEDKNCAALKPLHEYSLQNDLDNVYLTDKISMQLYGQRGYVYRGTVGYVVDDEGFCSSSVSAYNFLVSDVRHFYTSSQQEAEAVAARKGNYSSFWYQGIPFALWWKIGIVKNMLSILFALLLAHIAGAAGTQSRIVPLSEEDREVILTEVNKLRGSVGSGNMECLIWNSGIESEAQKLAHKCSIIEEPERYGVGVVYTSNEVASVSNYVDLVAESSSALSINTSQGCPCVAGKETQCNNYKQFTYWNAGQIGCAVSVCSSPPNVTMNVLTCLFARRINGGRCPYALGNECEFCSADFGCFDGLCCKPTEPDQKKTCGNKPEQLVPLYRLYHQPKKRMVLTTSVARRAELSKLGYSDFGTLGYISPKMQSQCSHLKALVELRLPSSDDYVYVVDEYSLKTYLQFGYVNVGVVGYGVDDESLCSIVQLFAAEPPSRDQWTKKHVGVVCLVKDYSAHGYFLRMYDITNGFLLWEQFMFDEFYSTRLCDELIAFEGDNCVYGLNFSSTDEATEFKRALDLKVQALQKRIARKVAQSQVSAASTYGRSTAYTPRFTPVTNMGVVMPSNCGFITKTKQKGRKHKKRITKEEIGEPTNFEHRVHVGWDPETGYAGHAVTDENEPDIQAILRMVNLPTDFKEDKKAVYSVINQFGGVEAVMRDLEHEQRVKATLNAPSPPPLPSRSHGRTREERQPKPLQPVATQHAVQKNVSRRAEWAPTPPPPPPPPSSSLRMSPPPTYVEATSYVATTVRAENANDQSAVSCAPPPAPPPPPPMVMFQAEETTPTVQASDARADLMAEIRRGKTLKRVDVGSTPPAATKKEIQSDRAELMTQIAQGVNLKPVDKAQPKAEPIPAAEELHGIAGALARALLERRSQMTAADESSEEEDDEEDDDDEWDD
ncbi:CAP and WH1 and PBD and WH2 domain containing pro tein [Trichuris trichiura]|uniref:CAP and WH1 and PBD and WH2 domain containing pro tein n=1 Tax=Trichuris trichiura TaxID=36087 RepID=A0A077ZDH4_TRITR|nr:CAP and WH1 and PBD and WH2 domain containing pro tein [Trichuris trichiura]